MIKKVIGKLKKVFIPRSEFIGDEPKKVEKPKENYIGVAAPVVTPTDKWFSTPVKTEKVIAYEEQVAEVAKQKEAEQPKSKEPKDIHQKMYEIATRSWNTVAESQGGSDGWQSGTGYNQFRP